MDAIEAILTRRTVPQVKMAPPGPDAGELQLILEAGAAAPDHGKLRPWRFLVVQGEARERLGELFAKALLRARPDAQEADVAKQRTAPLRAPVMIVIAVHPVEARGKIPPVEQMLSAGAAVQNMLIAAHAQGFAAKWSTGLNAYDPAIKAGLGLAAEDQIIGFVYIGSYGIAQAPSPRPALDEVTRPWPA
jgi:nitroreductase